VILTISRKNNPALLRSAAFWSGAAACAAAALGALVLTIMGPDDQGIHAALLATARLMFLVFFPAYTGSALTALFGAAFDPLRRHARDLGLAFAAMLAVHLSLVAWLCLIGDVPPARTFVVFGVAALCVYGLALFSIARLQRALGAPAWSVVRFLGMNYIALAFADDFLRDPIRGDIGHALFYWPFMALAIIGPALRGAAIVQEGLKRWGPARRSTRQTPVSESPTR
jgi:hypothetical protein